MLCSKSYVKSYGFKSDSKKKKEVQQEELEEEKLEKGPQEEIQSFVEESDHHSRKTKESKSKTYVSDIFKEILKEFRSTGTVASLSKLNKLHQ